MDSFESRMNPSRVPGRIGQTEKGIVVRSKSNRIREGKRWKVLRKTKREREELLFCRRSV